MAPGPSPGPGPAPGPHDFGKAQPRTNSLFVNGVRQVRARYPNGNPSDNSGKVLWIERGGAVDREGWCIGMDLHSASARFHERAISRASAPYTLVWCISTLVTPDAAHAPLHALPLFCVLPLHAPPLFCVPQAYASPRSRTPPLKGAPRIFLWLVVAVSSRLGKL
jgi:hypothetical protein